LQGLGHFGSGFGVDGGVNGSGSQPVLAAKYVRSRLEQVSKLRVGAPSRVVEQFRLGAPVTGLVENSPQGLGTTLVFQVLDDDPRVDPAEVLFSVRNLGAGHG
jgi:hypothetical protein